MLYRLVFQILSIFSVGLAVLCTVSLGSAEKIENLTLDTYVNDYADMIDAQTQDFLEQQLSSFAQESSHQILVVTVNDLDRDYIEHYSIKLAEKARAGSAEKDNGVILLLSKEERAVRIEVGYGLERVLTDGVSDQIIQAMIPMLKEKNYSQAIASAVSDMITITRQEVYTGTNQLGGGDFSHNVAVWFMLFYVLYIVLVWLSAILGRTKSWRLGGLIGAGIGLVVLILTGFVLINIILSLCITLVGFVFDYIVSQDYSKYIKHTVNKPSRWTGGTRGPGIDPYGGGFGSDHFGGGFSGGGGGFGGGGSSGKW